MGMNGNCGKLANVDLPISDSGRRECVARLENQGEEKEQRFENPNSLLLQ
jgi:hypothetical protein